MERKPRKTGYYWVRTENAKWFIAHYDHDLASWGIVGVAARWLDDNFVRISSNPIPEPNV